MYPSPATLKSISFLPGRSGSASTTGQYLLPLQISETGLIDLGTPSLVFLRTSISFLPARQAWKLRSRLRTSIRREHADRLHVHELLQAVHGELSPDPRPFDAPERDTRVGLHQGVHKDHTALQEAREPPGPFHLSRPEAGPQPE